MSGDIDRLEMHLKGDKSAQDYYFTELEDMILKKYKSGSEEIELLQKVKSKEII